MNENTSSNLGKSQYASAKAALLTTWDLYHISL
jgi:hypothetical protein